MGEYTAEQLLQLAHKYRATRIKTGPLEVEVHPSAFQLATEAELPGGPIGLEGSQPTDDELLHMSSGYEWHPEKPA